MEQHVRIYWNFLQATNITTSLAIEGLQKDFEKSSLTDRITSSAPSSGTNKDLSAAEPVSKAPRTSKLCSARVTTSYKYHLKCARNSNQQYVFCTARLRRVT